MKKITIFSFILFFVFLLASFRPLYYHTGSGGELDSLRKLYEKNVSEWPKPSIDSGVVWKEFKALPKFDTAYFAMMERPEVVLGKILFFDPILSASNQISCSTCHNPQTSWADKLSVSVGHDHQSGKRNTLSLLNVYARKSMFWDGRAATLEERVKNPIEAHDEMAMNTEKLF